MSKKPFASAQSFTPSVPLLSDLRGTKQREHGQFVSLLQNAAFVRGQKLIAEGKPPLKALRTAYGETCNDVAEAMNVPVWQYELLEKGHISLTEDNFVALALHYDVMPYHLCAKFVKAMPPMIVQATLRVYDTIDGNSDLKRDAHGVLSREKSVPETTGRLLIERERARKQLDKSFVVTFIDTLFLADKMNSRPAFVSAGDLVKDYTASLHHAEKDLLDASHAAQAHRDAMHKRYVLMGQRLYRDVQEDHVTWANVSQNISLMRQDMRVDNLVSYYRNNPASIGLDRWPQVNRDFFDMNGRYIGGWKAAHGKHADDLHRYIKSEKHYRDSFLRHMPVPAKIGAFSKWAGGYMGLIQRYCNRQMIKAHADFRDFPQTPDRTIAGPSPH